MTKIIPLRYSDIENVRKMIEYVSPGILTGKCNDEAVMHSPFNFISRMLPLNLKFSQESYVALEGREVLGLISLIPDGNQKKRWRINRLILMPNAYDAGKYLIDYVVNKFGGAGVEIFLTSINENYTEALTLFKTSCSFRSWSKINIWEYGNLKNLELSDNHIKLRKAETYDAGKLLELDTEALYPQFKTAFAKKEKDFRFGIKNKISNRLKNYKIMRFVLENGQKDSIESLLTILTEDNETFWIDITLSLACQEYYNEILYFALNKISSINSGAKLYISVRDFQQTGKKMTEVLSSHNFKQVKSFEILIKDYWKPIESTEENGVPIILFSDRTSPACMFFNWQ